MSADLINRSADLRRLRDEGFELECRGGYLLVHSVPYVTTSRRLARGTLVCALRLKASGEETDPPPDHTMYFVGEIPCHKDGQPITQIINNSNEADLGSGIVANHYFSSKPEGTGVYCDYYDKVVAYEGFLGRPARAYDPTANARTGARVDSCDDDNPFQYQDTASARYKIGAVTGKLRLPKVAIIGLGGTGSYVLDLVAKTPVKEIHLFDGDQLFNHNLFRSPGTPAQGDIKEFPLKVDYYTTVYSRMHKGVRPHPTYITEANKHDLEGFDFAFVCVDVGSARRLITAALSEFGVPFIDVGIGVGSEDGTLDGVVRVTSVLKPSQDYQAALRFLPFGDQQDDDEYEKAIQIADLNAINAGLAVMRWKRFAGFYRDQRNELNSVYMVEGNVIFNRLG